MRRALPVVLLVLGLPPAARAAPFTVGAGQNGGARFGRARGARRGFRTRFRARYQLRLRHARIPVRVIPRRGTARTLRLRVRRCGATR